MATYRDARIQLVEMVGAPNHENAVVGFEAVDLVEEVAPHVIGYDCVEIFKDEVAGGKLSRLGEYAFDGRLRPGPLPSSFRISTGLSSPPFLIPFSSPTSSGKRPPGLITEAGKRVARMRGGVDTYRRQTSDIESWDLRSERVQCAHRGLNRDGLPVARGPVVDQTPLPRHAQPAIGVPGREEGEVVLDDGALHALVQDDVVPRGLPHALVQLRALGPHAPVVHPDLAVQVGAPPPGGRDEVLGMPPVGREDVEVGHLREGGGAVPAVDQVDEELAGLPLVRELEEDVLDGYGAGATVEPAGGRDVDFPSERRGSGPPCVVIDGRVGGMARSGIPE